MGVLRLYLALCVIAAHSSGGFWEMHEGQVAVQIFFIISGFYMALVASSHKYPTARAFYLSRFLRIFPAYWLVLAATIFICVGFGLTTHRWLLLSPYFEAHSNNGLFGWILAAATNFSLFGQDWVCFISDDVNKPMRLVSDIWKEEHPLWNYLLVVQCWSVALELTFYLLVPLLNKLSSLALLSIACTSYCAKMMTFAVIGQANDPWRYRFFPFEIALFIFGMLSYRIYFRYRHRLSSRFCVHSTLGWLFGAATLLGIFYGHLAFVARIERLWDHHQVIILMGFPAWALFIAALFHVFSGSKIDRLVGELSFPVYLVHMILLVGIRELLPIKWDGPLCAVVSIAVSLVFSWKFIIPLDKFRRELAGTPAPR